MPFGIDMSKIGVKKKGSMSGMNTTEPAGAAVEPTGGFYCHVSESAIVSLDTKRRVCIVRADKLGAGLGFTQTSVELEVLGKLFMIPFQNAPGPPPGQRASGQNLWVPLQQVNNSNKDQFYIAFDPVRQPVQAAQGYKTKLNEVWGGRNAKIYKRGTATPRNSISGDGARPLEPGEMIPRRRW